MLLQQQRQVILLLLTQITTEDKRTDSRGIQGCEQTFKTCLPDKMVLQLPYYSKGASSIISKLQFKPLITGLAQIALDAWTQKWHVATF